MHIAIEELRFFKNLWRVRVLCFFNLSKKGKYLVILCNKCKYLVSKRSYAIHVTFDNDNGLFI